MAELARRGAGGNEPTREDGDDSGDYGGGDSGEDSGGDGGEDEMVLVIGHWL